MNIESGHVEKPEEIRKKIESVTYNVKEVAVMLDCGPESVRELCRDKTFPSLKIGKGFKIPKAAFHEWLEHGIFTTKQNEEASRFQRNKR